MTAFATPSFFFREATLQIDMDKERRELSGHLPAHVGIIMDGNGRWATKRGLPRALGHRACTERLRGIIRLSSDLGIRALSLYAFSTENWKRPKNEVDALFGLFMEYFTNEVEELHANGVRIRMLGDVNGLPANVRAAVRAAEEKTGRNEGLRLNVALNYGARAEAVRTIRALAHEAAAGTLNPEAIDEQLLLACLDTGGLPELDLLIRTGGEQRLSNFLLLQAAYAELAFVDTLWPDFSDALYMGALRDFAQRSRRFGGLQ